MDVLSAQRTGDGDAGAPKRPAWRPDSLTTARRRALRGEAHHLQAVVRVGKDGATDALLGALDAALTTHALVKVKVLQACTEPADQVADRCAQGTNAAHIQTIGRTLVFYRPRPEPEKQAAPSKRGSEAKPKSKAKPNHKARRKDTGRSGRSRRG